MERLKILTRETVVKTTNTPRFNLKSHSPFSLALLGRSFLL
jgi:hypothetical protein